MQRYKLLPADLKHIQTSIVMNWIQNTANTLINVNVKIVYILILTRFKFYMEKKTYLKLQQRHF